MITLTTLDLTKIEKSARRLARDRGVQRPADIDDIAQSAIVEALELAAQNKRINVMFFVDREMRDRKKNREVQTSDSFWDQLEG